MPVIGFLGTTWAHRLWPRLVNDCVNSVTPGRDIRIEYRWAEGKPERFAALAAELVALKVNAIMSAGVHSPPSPRSERRRPFPLFSVLSEIR